MEEINEKLKSNELIIKEEVQKASYNHEWVQEKVSKICDCIFDMSEDGGGVRKSSGSSEPISFARMTAMENKVNSMEKKIDRILTLLQAKS